MYQKWIFFGHILRQAEDTPANRAMRNYYNEDKEGGGKKRKRLGRRPTSLDECLVEELVRIDPDARRRLGVPKNVVETLPLEKLRKLAKEKQRWKTLSKAIAVRARFEWLVTYRAKKHEPAPEDSDAHETPETPRLLRNKRY